VDTFGIAQKEAGVSYAVMENLSCCFRLRLSRPQPKSKALQGHIDEGYRGFDLNYYDTKRAQRFISELKRFENEGDMLACRSSACPMTTPFGVARGKRTPIAYVADNDVSLGQIVEAVSHSKFWPQTAISWWKMMRRMGPTMVDAHRTVAFVVSPYWQKGCCRFHDVFD